MIALIRYGLELLPVNQSLKRTIMSIKDITQLSKLEELKEAAWEAYNNGWEDKDAWDVYNNACFNIIDLRENSNVCTTYCKT